MPKEIIDVCCGSSLKVNPDIMADFKNIPFKDESFSLVKLAEVVGYVKNMGNYLKISRTK